MAAIGHYRLAQFCRRFATAYKAGLDMRSIWEREAQHGSMAQRRAAASIRDSVQRGETLADAMAASRVFPPMVVAVARTGESGGRLDRAFNILAKYYESMVRFRWVLVSRLAWPMTELCLAIIVIGVLILFLGSIVPGGVDWLGLGWTTSQYFAGYVSLVVIGVAAIGGLVLAFRRGWLGETPMNLARMVPLVGKTIEVFALARFAWSLSAVLESGMSVVEGSGLALEATNNYFYTQHKAAVSNKLQGGQSLYETLLQTQAFPSEFLLMVDNGEISGELPDAMNHIADMYLEKAEANLRILATVGFFLAFGFIAVVIGITVILLYQKLYLAPMQDFGI
jgi:type II secretory pathway component PulF